MLKVTYLEGQAEMLGFVHKAFLIHSYKTVVACGVEVTKLGSSQHKFNVYEYDKEMLSAIKQLFNGKEVLLSRPLRR